MLVLDRESSFTPSSRWAALCQRPFRKQTVVAKKRDNFFLRLQSGKDGVQGGKPAPGGTRDKYLFPPNRTGLSLSSEGLEIGLPGLSNHHNLALIVLTLKIFPLIFGGFEEKNERK